MGLFLFIRVLSINGTIACMLAYDMDEMLCAKEVVRMKDPKENRKDPFGELMKPIDRFFQEKPVKGFLQSIDELFNKPSPFHFGPSFPVDVSETDNEYVIKAELPGVNREQIQIHTLDQYVNITVESYEEVIEEDERRHSTSRQRSMQRLSRSIPLAQPINEKKVKASYKNGLLVIRVAKLKGKTILIDDES